MVWKFISYFLFSFEWRRIYGIELSDTRWCPKIIKDCVRSLLQIGCEKFKCFSEIFPLFKEALHETQDTQIIDLCSGAGGPWKHFEEDLMNIGVTKVVLTDINPQEGQLEGDFYEHCSYSVDARAVPRSAKGFRTMFSAFHHFKENEKIQIIRDSISSNEGIGIFEVSERNIWSILFAATFMIPTNMIVCPMIKPRKLSFFLLTYSLIVPLIMIFDGVMSCLRTQTVDEMKEMISVIPDHETYDWKIGKIYQLPLSTLYIIGTPKKK